MNIKKNLLNYYQHATGTYNRQQKLEQLNYWRKELNISLIDWNDLSFGNSCSYIQNLCV